jgi:hypothetical protein
VPPVLDPTMRLLTLFALFALSSCATRSASDALSRNSAASIEAREAPLAAPAVALVEEPPLPDEAPRSSLWSALDDPDAAVFPLPSEPGAAWSASDASHPTTHEGHEHHAR